MAFCFSAHTQAAESLSSTIWIASPQRRSPWSSRIARTSFRHGGFTEAGDADLTDAQIRAQRGHKSAKVLTKYVKRRMSRRKRRSGGALQEQTADICQNDQQHACQNGEAGIAGMTQLIENIFRQLAEGLRSADLRRHLGAPSGRDVKRSPRPRTPINCATCACIA